MTPEQEARWHRVKLPSGTVALLLPGPWLWDGDRMFNRAVGEIIKFDNGYLTRAFDERRHYDGTLVCTEQEAIDDVETTLRHVGWTLTSHGAAIGPTLDQPSAEQPLTDGKPREKTDD